MLLVGVVNAAELKGTVGGSLNALNTGYAIARWPWSNGNIYPGETATVRACTTMYPKVTTVKFRWNAPDGSHIVQGPYALTDMGDTWDGKTIYYAEDSLVLDQLGDWGVQALFYNSEGKLMHCGCVFKIRAISWHVIPEAALGTIGVGISMIGALAIFKLRKKTSSKKFSNLHFFPWNN
jgi:hypothetical protein